eukprot:PITA_34435
MPRVNPKPSKEENLQTPEQEGKKPKKTTKKPVKEDEAGVSVNSKPKTDKGDSVTKPRREKKVYILPGQKYDPPEERDPLRIFYSSLHRQIPCSEMAQNWMMEHGLLSPDMAKQVYEKKLKKQAQTKASTKASRKNDLPEDDKKVQPKSLTKSSQKIDLSDDYKKVQTKNATISRQKKSDEKPRPKASTKSSKKNIVFSDDESDDFVQPKKQRCS